MLALTQRVSLTQKLTIDMPFDKAGEVELLSLHRIKNRMSSMQIHPTTRRTLISNLVEENAQYRIEGRHRRYCITPDHLDSAVDSTKGFLKEQSDNALSTLEGEIKERLGGLLYEKVEEQNAVMKVWFHDNYNEIIYDTTGNIPYQVVLRLRDSFRMWAFDNINPFQQPMEEVISEVMTKLGYDTKDYNDPHENWKILKELDQD